MRRLFLLLWVVFSLSIHFSVQAQSATSLPIIVTVYRETVIYSGPGDTYLQVGLLTPGIEVNVVQRNRTGNWLRVIGVDARVDGWVMHGYLNPNPEMRFSTLPLAPFIGDADLANVSAPSLARLYAAPVIPEVSEAMREVYLLGQSLGRRANVVSKVGDSMSADALYLTPMSRTDYVLGPYDYLEETIQFFGPSIPPISAAARLGLTSATVFDPMWSDPALCRRGVNPLMCEVERSQPSMMLVMFGANDVLAMTTEEYHENIRRIVQTLLEHGVIPILSTFSYDPDLERFPVAVNFNLALVDAATEYQVPLINLWSAARALPNYGLDRDNIHMRHSGFYNLKFDTGHEAWYGASLRNLLSIRMLDELRRKLEIG
jgi:hypothetical protein